VVTHGQRIAADGKYHDMVTAEDGKPAFKIAFSRNGRQVSMRDARDQSKVITVSTDAWQDFLEKIRNGSFDNLGPKK
jgi:hypothetical protein